MSIISTKSPIGVNGIGRIGKLLVWLLTAKYSQEEIVISTGREVGNSIEDLAFYLQYDSTYGNYNTFFFGFNSHNRVEIKDGSIFLNDVKVIWLNKPEYRVPGAIPWSDYGVDIVFDTTGTVSDPTDDSDKALRGHLNHARKVILTAPFKVKKKGTSIPDDAVTIVGGVNSHKFDPMKHNVISNASCTTNCCAPPIKALVDHFGEKMISYSLTTIHASTNTQSTLDVLPKSNDKDTRKRRSIINNMIPTTTGAAQAVLEVIPELQDLGIGSQASSIRVPTNTGSIVVLDISLIGEYDNEYINSLFKEFARNHPTIMHYSKEQLVSSDIIGNPCSSIYDSMFTHRRTVKRDNQLYTMVDLNFWYDNEFGYVNSLSRLYDLVTGNM
jgi:glyceraldehyde 3-phosphate dehydrogenase